ncbi:hypothetical protein ES706_00314 [subsurface metagenome]|nr:hypothetical protein [Hadesarchaea archaeon]
MDKQGIGYIVDMLVFALLISFASLLLVGASPIDPKIESTRYAASFAQSTLLALQHSTADEFGGFEYQLDTLSFEPNVPVLKGSTKRNLRHKALTQLLVEDALFNLHIEAEGVGLEPPGPSWGMKSELREFLKGVLDKLIGGRFGYRLIVRTLPLDLGFVRVHFESEIKNFDEGAQRKLCSETIVATLPISQGELTQRIQKVLDTTLELEPDIAVEITLELWSS